MSKIQIYKNKLDIFGNLERVRAGSLQLPEGLTNITIAIPINQRDINSNPLIWSEYKIQLLNKLSLSLLKPKGKK